MLKQKRARVSRRASAFLARREVEAHPSGHHQVTSGIFAAVLGVHFDRLDIGALTRMAPIEPLVSTSTSAMTALLKLLKLLLPRSASQARRTESCRQGASEADDTSSHRREVEHSRRTSAQDSHALFGLYVR